MDTLHQFLQLFSSRLHFFNTFNYKNDHNHQITDHTMKTETIVKSDPQLLQSVKTRFNYAASACSARVISSNPHSQSSASILVSNKDSYLRNLCSNVHKFVVIELCQEVKVDTVVLGNYELFSSTFRRFRLHGAKSLDQTNTTQSTWKLLLSAEMQNGPLLHSDQAFPLAPKDFIKFLRIDFDDQHGNEHWCPVSSLKVYGKTMIDEFNDEVKKQLSLSKGLSIENEIIKSPSSNLAIYSITPELEIIYKQMSRLRFKITQAQLKVSFFHFNNNQKCNVLSLIKLQTQCPIEEEPLSLLKDRYTSLETKSFVLKSSLLSGPETDGNVFKILHDRLNKLETSFQQSPLNFLNSFLLRSRQDVPQITTTSSNLSSNNKSAESSIEELFSTLTSDIYKLKSDHHLLQSNLSTQKSYIYFLIILNLLILTIFIGYILKSLIKTKTKTKTSKSSSNSTTSMTKLSKSSDFKRLPLSELKSPTGSISKLNSCSQSPPQSPISLSPVSVSSLSSQKSTSLGLILSDDEVLLSEPKLQIKI